MAHICQPASGLSQASWLFRLSLWTPLLLLAHIQGWGKYHELIPCLCVCHCKDCNNVVCSLLLIISYNRFRFIIFQPTFLLDIQTHMVEHLLLKGEKSGCLRQQGRKRVHEFFKWPCCLGITTQPQMCDLSPTTLLLPKGFRSLKFACGCCPLDSLVTPWLPENHSDSLCCCLLHILCFFRLPHSLSSTFHLLTPIQHCTHYYIIARLQTMLCEATLHPGISCPGQKFLQELGFFTEHHTWAIKLWSNIGNFPNSGIFLNLLNCIWEWIIERIIFFSCGNRNWIKIRK